MRDNEVVVRATLTGKFGQKCFYCRAGHTGGSTIQRCVHRFVTEVFGAPFMRNKFRVTYPSELAMLKRGQHQRYAEFMEYQRRCRVWVQWKPAWEDFITCETAAEAYGVAEKKLAEWRVLNFENWRFAHEEWPRLMGEYGDLMRTDHKEKLDPVLLNVTHLRRRGYQPNSVEVVVIDVSLTVPIHEVVSFYQQRWDYSKGIENQKLVWNDIQDVDINSGRFLYAGKNVGEKFLLEHPIRSSRAVLTEITDPAVMTLADIK